MIDVDLDDDGLVGQVVPVRRGRLEVRVGGALEQVVEVDELGSFAVRPLPVGPFCLVLDDGVRRVATPWTTAARRG